MTLSTPRPKARIGVLLITLLIALGVAVAATQSSANATPTTAPALARAINKIDRHISMLGRQVRIVRRREKAVHRALRRDRARLHRVHLRVLAERRRIRLLKGQLLTAQDALSHQAVSSNTIRRARIARARAIAANRRLTRLQNKEIRETRYTAAEFRGLVRMHGLIWRRIRAASRLRRLRRAALHSAGVPLNKELAYIRSQGRMAIAGLNGPRSRGHLKYGEWAIPAAIVNCESGGQNDPPNSAGASGYYQIMPATWKGLGGRGPAAYLAPKWEQDKMAAKLWAGGSGASNWTCAGIVGIR